MSEAKTPSRGHLLDRALAGLTVGMAVIGAIGILAIMVITVMDVVTRTTTGGSFGGLVEYTEVLLVVAVFMSIPYAQLRGAHVGVSVLTERMPARAASGVYAAGLVVVASALGWMVWASLERALISFSGNEYRFGLALVPVWPARIAVAVGLAIWLVTLLYALVKALSETFSDVPGGENARRTVNADEAEGR